MKNNYLTNFFISIFLLIVLLACVKNRNTNIGLGKTIQLKEPTTLKWIGHWKGEGLKEQLVKNIAREFEFENQDVKIHLQFPEDVYYNTGVRGNDTVENDFNKKNILASQSEWDIIRINHDSTLRKILNDAEWAEKYLVDVSKIKEIEDGLIPSVLTDEYKSTWSGILPGAPLDASNYVLFCNVEVAREVGIEVKQFNMTFDDFLGYIQAVYNYNKKNNTDLIAIIDNSDWSCLDVIPQQLFCSEIGSYEELVSGKYTKEKEAAFRKVLSSLQELGKYKPLPEDISKFMWSTSGEIILNDKCLFYPQGSWMYNIWLSADSIKYKKIIPVQLPGYKKAATYLGEYRIPWAIPKNSPHQEEAVRLMKYLCKTEVADTWVRYTKSPTGIKGSIVSTTMGFDAYENFDYTITSQYKNTKIARTPGSAFYLGKNNSSYTFNFRDIIKNDPKEVNGVNHFLRSLRK